MATTSMTKAKGLFTFSNYLSSIPEGSLFDAENTVIDRDGVIEPRRGIKVEGEIPFVAKQLLTYKNRILAHYDNAIAYSNGLEPATYTVFKGKADFSPSDVSIVNDNITINSHGLVDQDELIFSSTGVLPAGLSAGVTYYVQNATPNTFQVGPNPISAPINFTTQGTGIHTVNYDYVFEEVDANLRIKYIEMNGNLYVTTNTGIKKIYGLSPYYVTNAGGIRALDVELQLDLSSTNGFLETDREVAYRVTWGTTDINNNFIEGFPSFRAVIRNQTGTNRNVIVSFPVPTGVTTDYFYRIYRTNTAVIDGSGDEMRLVYEGPYQGTSHIVVTDEQPEDLRDTGVPLYSNELSGEGILQANAIPPVAKDIAIYKNTAFFANTRTAHRMNITLLGQDGLGVLDVVSMVGNVVTTTTNHNLTNGHEVVIVGAGAADGMYPVTVLTPTTFSVPSVAATGSDTINVYTSSVTIDKGTISNTYYFVGRSEITNVIYQSKAATLASSYFLLNSADDKIKYAVWFDKTGTDTPPTPTVGEGQDRVLLRVDISAGAVVTAADVAAEVQAVLENTGDFIVSDYTTSQDIATADSGVAGTIAYPSGITGAVSPFAAPSDISVPQQGFGEDVSKHYIKLSSFVSPAQRIESTARSLAYVINNNPDEVVFAYYTPDTNELPGSIFIESKVTDINTFSIVADSATTGSMFNPNLTTAQVSTNETYGNRLYFSKTQQPEAVPLTNNIDIGPRDKAILRIIGLRDSLFILKEEGVYRLTGENFTNFQVTLFDNSVNILAADSACVLNNQIYCLTSQGVATISETGVGIISRPIENIFNRISSPAFTTFSTTTFGFGYEADRSYLLFTPDKPDDTSATRCYRYNTFTQSWTNWKKSATCGVVETSKNKMYIGPPDIAAVEVERKTLTSRDYADREYTRQASVYNSGLIYLDDVSNIEPGDILMQTQYLTHYHYNRLVVKAKSDPTLQLPANFPEITELGTNLQQAMIDLVDQLNISDASLINLNFDAAADVDIVTNTFTIANHNLQNNDAVQLTGSDLPDPLIANTYYFVVNRTTNTFQLSATQGGTAVDLTVAGSGSATISEMYYLQGSSDFAALQSDFNYNVNKLNVSQGVYWGDYKTSTGTFNLDLLVETVIRQGNKVTVENSSLFFIGPFTHYKAIKATVVWAPMDLGEPSISKHIREGVFILENPTLHRVTLAYASDLSGNFEDIPFKLNGEGGWGDSEMGNVVWSGEGISWPLRTLIPRQKQRCRYIRARFKHSIAMFKFSIMGIAYTYETVSERSYR